ncbi:ATP-binding cassette domain-containing protein, partial [Liquorilactobacillus vini]|uniref:ATP-binding cassette domain-containing protein n=1 Tax=Liquorilactobacillus vini TaxID=238015 RepID=UPI000558FBD3
MLIKVNNMSVTISNKVILKDINLNIAEGTVTVLIGPSGAGKSTLLRTLNLLQIPSKGVIDVDGIKAEAGKIDKKIVHEIRNNSTMVFQQ